MLLLARKAGQSVVIDGNILVTVDRIRGRVVRLKVEAPRKMPSAWTTSRDLRYDAARHTAPLTPPKV